MKASNIAFHTAVLSVLIGMSWGIMMAMTHDHSTMPAHAHLNLLGWVSLFLMGLFYRAHENLDRSRAAKLQVAVWFAGTAILTIGVGLIHSQIPIGEPIAAISSLVLLANMAFIWWMMARTLKETGLSKAVPSPAE